MTASEPRYFNELIRILDNVRTGDTISVARNAEDIAKKYATKGFHERADKIRQRTQRLNRNSDSSMRNLEQQAERLGLEIFYPADSALKAKDYVVSEKNRVVIKELVQVMQKKEVFWEAEIPLPNKTLMFGAPGTGKTVCAHYIAEQLNLPLVLVRLDAMIDSALGGTAKNIRAAFDLGNKQPCVLFLDEFDAIGTDRKRLNGDGAELEMKRVVNSLLQNLDALNDEVLLFAATNLDSEIDPAVWRRFQNRMNFELPTINELVHYLNRNINDMFLVEQVLTLFQDKSFAEIEIVLNRAKTKAILRSSELTAEVIEESLMEQLEQVH